MYLVKKLNLFVNFRVIVFVITLLELLKVIGLVLYQFFHGLSANIMVDRFNVVVFMMCEYVDIVVFF
jgi:hypothetical protein